MTYYKQTFLFTCADLQAMHSAIQSSDAHQSPDQCKRPREESWNGTMAMALSSRDMADWQWLCLEKKGSGSPGPRAKAVVPSEKETGLRPTQTGRQTCPVLP